MVAPDIRQTTIHEGELLKFRWQDFTDFVFAWYVSLLLDVTASPFNAADTPQTMDDNVGAVPQSRSAKETKVVAVQHISSERAARLKKRIMGRRSLRQVCALVFGHFGVYSPISVLEG